MTFILIIMTFAGTGPAITTAEFYSLRACEAAATSVKANANWKRDVVTTCVEKGSIRD